MAEEKKRLTAVERAELALAEAKAKAEEKNKLKRKAALVELARRRQAMQNAGVKVTDATEAAIQAGASEEDIENLDVAATLAEAEAEAESKAKPKPAAKAKATAKKDESKES